MWNFSVDTLTIGHRLFKMKGGSRMRYSDKDCIVIGFNEDLVHLTSVILMDGKSGLKKKIQVSAAKIK